MVDVVKAMGVDYQIVEAVKGNRMQGEVKTEKTRALGWECKQDLGNYINGKLVQTKSSLSSVDNAAELMRLNALLQKQNIGRTKQGTSEIDQNYQQSSIGKLGVFEPARSSGSTDQNWDEKKEADNRLARN